MWRHSELANTPFGALRRFKQLVNHGDVTFGGNQKLKIYDKLNCKSGKRIKTINRVFFSSADEAISAGYRPCGHCMRAEYQQWKEKKSQINFKMNERSFIFVLRCVLRI